LAYIYGSLAFQSFAIALMKASIISQLLSRISFVLLLATGLVIDHPKIATICQNAIAKVVFAKK